jgi:hypothetical protein
MTPKQWITVIAWIVGQLVVFGGVLAGLIYWALPAAATWAGGDVEVVLGFILLAAWAAVVLWGLAQIALSARREQGDRDYLTGLVVGCALSGGIMLMFFRHIEADVFGAGFALALISSLFIWAGGREARHRRRK